MSVGHKKVPAAKTRMRLCTSLPVSSCPWFLPRGLPSFVLWHYDGFAQQFRISPPELVLRRSGVALAGETITVAILVSFTELPSIPELSRFEGDDRRASFTAVPLPDGWLNYFRV